MELDNNSLQINQKGQGKRDKTITFEEAEARFHEYYNNGRFDYFN